MNIEKLVNSKFYRGFEWFYRLIFLNILIVLVSFSLAAIPFLIWYNNQELGFLVIIALVLFVFMFIPAYITSFIIIKHYMDDRTGNLFLLYYQYFIDTIKRVYLIEIIFIPILLLTLYGIYYYWQILGPDYYQDNIYGLISILSFVVEFFVLVLLLLMFINLGFLVTHFRMKIFAYIRMSFRFSLRYMGQTMISLVMLFIPIVILYILGMKFVPIYFISGISLPQLLMYLLIRNKYNYLQRNVDDLETENKYE